jgi:hypothetical protein
MKTDPLFIELRREIGEILKHGEAGERRLSASAPDAAALALPR